MSEHIKERLGRKHPLFRFRKRPLYASSRHAIRPRLHQLLWDAYDTFIKELLGFLKGKLRER